MTIQQLINVLTPIAKSNPNLKVLWMGLAEILYISKRDKYVYISDGN